AAAHDDESETNALWGLTMTLMQAEDEGLRDVLTQFVRRRERTPVNLVRGTQAEMLWRRMTNLADPVDVAEALHALEALTDPRTTTSFMNTYAYHLVLSGSYEDAFAIASTMSQVADEYQLKWAQPHAHWALAASALGLRRFRKAEDWLRRVEKRGDELRYGQLLVNAACLRARLLLALQRPAEALEALAVDETHTVSRAMRGEYLATRALALAVNGATAEAAALANRAVQSTNGVEARAYASCAAAVVAQSSGGRIDDVLAHFRAAESLGVWDAIVASVRAAPELLAVVVTGDRSSSQLKRALRASCDHDLARHVGIDLGRRVMPADARTVLSPREKDVLELVKQGLTNREIAQTLFLAQSTVKVHVHHILEKTGMRSRTEAAASDFDD